MAQARRCAGRRRACTHRLQNADAVAGAAGLVKQRRLELLDGRHLGQVELLFEDLEKVQHDGKVAAPPQLVPLRLSLRPIQRALCVAAAVASQRLML